MTPKDELEKRCVSNLFLQQMASLRNYGPDFRIFRVVLAAARSQEFWKEFYAVTAFLARPGRERKRTNTFTELCDYGRPWESGMVQIHKPSQESRRMTCYGFPGIAKNLWGTFAVMDSWDGAVPPWWGFVVKKRTGLWNSVIMATDDVSYLYRVW